MKNLLTLTFILAFLTPVFAAKTVKTDPVLNAMQDELTRSFKKMSKMTPPVYFLSYQITDTDATAISASLGALNLKVSQKNRILDVEARVGSRQMDNTRKIKAAEFSNFQGAQNNKKTMPLDDNELNIKQTLWLATDEAVKNAQENYLKVKTNSATASERGDNSDDFSPQLKPQQYYETLPPIHFAVGDVINLLLECSKLFEGNSFILTSSIDFYADNNQVYYVSSEGAKIKKDQNLVRLIYSISSRNSDGMIVERSTAYDGISMQDLPSKEVIMADIRRSIAELKALQTAPIAEPYQGPVLLKNKAAGVFFHEVLGHRVEGHRQKDDDFGQTFTKKVGQEVLSPLLSVYDDPTISHFKGIPLRGYYKYDDEGVPAQRVTIIKDGVLQSFLMSRNPVSGFPQSNGHGRKAAGYSAVSRMGTTIVEAKETIPFDQLKIKFKEEIKKQNKPYGIMIEDISGGFTNVNTYAPQAFKVTPLLVYRVYPDDIPDEIIRGADLVGTPLTSFNKVIAAGDDYAVFNGSCGAESGWVPVSAIAPSLLISELEVEKVEKTYSNLPLSAPPPVKKAQKEENKK